MAFEKIKKNFGFGCMRLPMIGDEVDLEQTKQMVDRFFECGFNYFDTAHGYIDTLSEKAIRECIAKRYEREEYVLADKLSGSYFKRQEDIRPFFASQLEACGVDYFDIYLMHAQESGNFEHYKSCRAYETAFELKAEGKICHVGISFHDSAEVLDKILTEYPEIETVQIQYNYLDIDDPSVQSEGCLQVCRKHGVPAIVMEPVKGGSLANLPADAAEVFSSLGDASAASYAVRFAAGAQGVMMTLSGMSSLEQMNDNLSFMTDFKPLNADELNAVDKVRHIFKLSKKIGCTACRYCVEGCAEGIDIPELLGLMNKKIEVGSADIEFYRELTANGGKASSCIKCGACESVCPQHLPIRELLEKVSREFEV